MQRSDRIGMQDEIRPRQVADDSFEGGASRKLIRGHRGLRIDAHQHERAERLDSTDRTRQRAGKAQAWSDIGLDLGVAEGVSGALRSERPNLDLMRIKRWIDR